MVSLSQTDKSSAFKSLTYLTDQLETIIIKNVASSSVDILPSIDQKTRLYRLNLDQPNPRENTRFRSSRLITFNEEAKETVSALPGFPILENEIVAESYSPKFTYRVLIRKKKGDKGEDKTTLELWSSTNLLRSVRLSDYHGDIYSDPTFTLTPIVWCQDETKIIYIAEKKEDKKLTAWDDLKTSKDTKQFMESYSFKQDLGEGFDNKFKPELYVYNLESNEVSKVLNIPKDTLPAFPMFADQWGRRIILGGFAADEFFRGIRFCFNNPIALYLITNPVFKKMVKEEENAKKTEEDLDDEQDFEETECTNNPPFKMTKDFVSIFPLLSPDGSKLAFFFHDKPQIMHNFNLGLKVIDFKSNGASEEVVPIVHDNDDKFTGIVGFHMDYKNVSWLKDSKHLAFGTDSRGGVRIFLVNTETKQLKQLDTPKYQSEAWNLLKVDGDKIIARVSHRISPDRLAIYSGLNLDEKEIDKATEAGKWHYFDTLTDEPILSYKGKKENIAERGTFQEEIIQHKGIESLFWWIKDYKNDDGETVPEQSKPLVVILHGGPHGQNTGYYSNFIYLLLCRGFSVLAPNFSGSTGYGQKHIEKLLGKTGVIDISEVNGVIHKLLEDNRVDGRKVGLYGGSYGGYLSFAYLTQYPEQFRTAIIANPVVNYHFSVTCSDIPEWAIAESLMKEYGELSLEDFKKTIELSPSCKEDKKKIKSKIQLVLGSKDKRVPPAQALEFFRNLKKEGVNIECNIYPDEGHSLANSLESLFDYVLRCLLFLELNLKA
eukprot:CAMPEP_0176417028 /NCGR_PEP_ID=MMETSP0127-20121128/6662_1 /TAXON_ID=938130 /ORGANISM="Platyophrya macrostoma, Strain WH" /LENGTH=771 /DNA_ID=CAMNT_0017797145 /DNA_START=45 /DNA_END=2360 /DNA_ORIENTATION=-